MNVFTTVALNELSHCGLEPVHPILHIKDRSEEDLLSPIALKLRMPREHLSCLKTFVVCADNGNIKDVTYSATLRTEGDCLTIELTTLNV